MWKLPPMSDSAEYVLCFCQDNEQKRFCSVIESTTTHPFEVARTSVIPTELLRKRQWETVSKQYKLLPYNLQFVFGPHGEWLTEPEAQALFGPGVATKIPWVTGCTPNLPPK